MTIPSWLAIQTPFRLLAEKVQSQEIVPFLGAGMSREASFPDWKGLTTSLLEKVKAAAAQGTNAQAFDDSDLLFAAEHCRRELGDGPFEAEVCRLLEVTGSVRDRIAKSANYHALASLNLPLWLTTNFDLALEEALKVHAGKIAQTIDWSHEERVNLLLTRTAIQNSHPVCVHLHGTVGTDKSLIFTELDYQRRYWRSDYDRVRLFMILTSYPVVTMGFSLEDHDFMSILREVKAKLAFREPRHFALLSCPSIADIEARIKSGQEASRLKEKYGIAPVYFPLGKKGDYAQLGTLLTALAAEPEAAPVLPPKPVARRRVRVPDDPQKGWWGGLAESGGFRLNATVTADGSDWFDIAFEVKRLRSAAASPKMAIFHLHDTFHPDRRQAAFDGDRARLELGAYGAFTVGVEVKCEGNKTIRLELDLASLKEAPALFRSR